MRPYQFLDRKGNLYQTRADLQRSIAVAIFGLLLFILPFVPFIRDMHYRTLHIILIICGTLISAFAYDFYRSVIRIGKDHNLLSTKKNSYIF